MKVCGFSFVRNAIKYAYPIKEAIQPVLPLCDCFVIAVGNSEDDTLNYIKNINSDKIQIIETIWDDSLREGGAVLAVETNKAFDAYMYHYGWVKNPSVMMEKLRATSKLWHDEEWIKEKFKDLEFFDYTEVSSVELFKGTHPLVMKDLINNLNWHPELDPNRIRLSAKEKILGLIEKRTGRRLFEYRNYRLI